MSIVPITAFPRHLLHRLFLSGDASLWALQSDPRFHYRIYVPDAKYPQSASTSTQMSVLVSVHGTGRHLERHINAWKEFADKHGCVVLVPGFPAGLQGPLDVDGYQFLGRRPKLEGDSMNKIQQQVVQIPKSNRNNGKDDDAYQEIFDIRHDLVLFEMLNEVRLRWPAVDITKFYMAGFSGGGQFVHRFLYLHPDRVLGVSVGAPGVVTYLDSQRDWPAGVRNLDKIFGRPVDFESVKAVPVLCVVGRNDVKAHGPKLRADLEIKMFDGKEDVSANRVEMLENFATGLRDAGLQVQLEIVDGAAHEMESCNRPVVEFMQRLMEARS